MKYVAVLLVAATFCVILGAPLPQTAEHKLGKGWEKRKDKYGNEEYARKIELTQKAIGRTKFFHTRFPLEDFQRDLHIWEALDWRGRTLTVDLPKVEDRSRLKDEEDPKQIMVDDPIMKIERTEDKDGKAVKHSVLLGNVRYFDLDGDGMLDGMLDNRNEKDQRNYINISNADGEMQWLRIQTWNRKHNMNPVIIEAYNEKKNYVFEKGTWREWTTEDQRKREGLDKPKDK